jgi:hypothetical protein
MLGAKSVCSVILQKGDMVPLVGTTGPTLSSYCLDCMHLCKWGIRTADDPQLRSVTMFREATVPIKVHYGNLATPLSASLLSIDRPPDHRHS